MRAYGANQSGIILSNERACLKVHIGQPFLIFSLALTLFPCTVTVILPLEPTLLSTHFSPFPCTHTIRMRPHIQARSCFPGLLAISALSLAHTARARPRLHARSLMPAGPSPHPFPPVCCNHHPHTSAHPGSAIPTGPSPHLIPAFFPCAPTARTRPRSHTRSCLPGTNIFPYTAPSPFPLNPIPPFVLHLHRPHTSAHPRSLMPTRSPPIFQCFPLHTVRTRPRIHARSCPPGLLPNHFHFFPCAHTVRTRPRIAPTPCTRPCVLARSCPLGLLLTLSFHPHRRHNSAHPYSLMPTRPSRHPFPPFLAPPLSPHVRTFMLAHGHRAFSPPISTFPLHQQKANGSRLVVITGQQHGCVFRSAWQTFKMPECMRNPQIGGGY